MKLHVNGISVEADTFGSAREPAVLLVMGAMASGVWWPERFCQALAERGRYVIRYDHRDTGGSTAYAPGSAAYGAEDLAWDAVGVLDALGIGRAHWVGMSLGGYLSQLVAVAKPERVLSLTLIASEPLATSESPPPGIDPEVLAWHRRAADLDWSNREAVLDYQVGAWRLISGSAHAFDAAHIRALAEVDYDRTPNPQAAFNHATLKDVSPAWLGRLQEIRVPVLIIHGTEDKVLPYGYARALQAAFPASRLVTLEGTGHELHPADWPTILSEVERQTSG